jgi:hypothetical protein
VTGVWTSTNGENEVGERGAGLCSSTENAPLNTVSDTDRSLTHSLTHGAEPFSRSRQLCSYSRTSQHLTLIASVRNTVVLVRVSCSCVIATI